MASGKTVIVTGGSQGIGAAIVQAFLERGYNVVATSRSISKAGCSPSPDLALVDGDISHAETAQPNIHFPSLPCSIPLDASRLKSTIHQQ
jgi:NAD(P)-dependent dehydrogenase (short-subunit alcohol dehydrogenase family)